MQETLARAGRVVVLAGLFISGVAFASGQPLSPPVPAGVTKESAPTPATPDRELEARIELGLLADPLTFPYPFKVQMSKAGLALQGYVPSDAVRQRALAIARQVCNGPVADRVEVRSSLRRSASKTPANFLEQVCTQVVQASPENSKGIQIHLTDTNQVVLSGHVSSLEEKLRVSRQLRGLAGCGAVKNELLVRADAKPAEENVIQQTAVKPVVPPPPPAPSGDLNSVTLPPAAPRQIRTGEAKPNTDPGPVEKAPKAPVITADSPKGDSKSARPPAVLTGMAKSRLAKKITQATDNALREVELTFDGKGGVKIAGKMKNVADVERVATKVIQVPDLAEYQVTLEFEMDKPATK